MVGRGDPKPTQGMWEGCLTEPLLQPTRQPAKSGNCDHHVDVPILQMGN